MTIEAKYVDVSGRRLFVLLHRAVTRQSAGGVLIIPALFEEQNRCRNVVSCCARSLSAAGFDVVIGDLSGTGDSEGHIEDADWATWERDLVGISNWFSGETGHNIVNLLSVRAGMLFLPGLLASFAVEVGVIVAWQPIFSGRKYVEQLIRLRVVSDAINGERTTGAEVQSRFANGESVEIGGYSLNHRLYASIRDINVNGEGFERAKGFRSVRFEPDTEARISSSSEDVSFGADNVSVVQFDHFWSNPISGDVNVVALATLDALYELSR